MDLISIRKFLRSTDGVNQLQRSLTALAPDFIGLDERNRRDLLAFMRNIAPQVRFFELEDRPAGDWQAFFDALAPAGQLMSENALEVVLSEKEDWPPHLALMLAFLKIFSRGQKDLNKLTGRHLQYFYENILQIGRKKARPDQLHVLFELAKNASPQLLKAGTKLDAGKTKDGEPLHYLLDHELIVNTTRIGNLKSVYVEQGLSDKTYVFKAEDARLVKAENDSGWRPFGMPQFELAPASRKMEEAQLGFAISSPAILLAEGTRSIEIKLQLQTPLDTPPQALQMSHVFELTVSGENGWLSPSKHTAELKAADAATPLRELVFTLDFTAGQDAIIAYSEDLHGPDYKTQWPLFQCLIRSENFALEKLSSFLLVEGEIRVNVKGVKDLILQNDQSVQPADKPILPFGTQPQISSNFYIGHREAFSKSLESLSVHLDWQDIPTDFSTHYLEYGVTGLSAQGLIQNNSFTTAMYLLTGRSWDTVLTSNQPLFVSSDISQKRSIEVIPSTFASRTEGVGFGRIPELDPFSSFGIQQRQGFIKLVLTGPNRTELGDRPVEAPFEAFGHKSFPTIYTQQAIALSKHDSGTAPKLPKAPYTPILKSVELDYSAKEVFRPSNPNAYEQFFIRDIFGTTAVKAKEPARLAPVLPGQAALYIGLEAASVPQLTSFLFQIEEGDVPGAELLNPTDLEWSYLSDNQWQTLQAQDVIEEATDTFQKPGLIRLNIGADASDTGGLMPKGQHWIRAAVRQRAEGAGTIQAIHPQAGRARLSIPPEKAATFEEHLRKPLPAMTVSRLNRKLGTIKKVEQPYPSFGGLSSERNNAYFQRVSERLRHKNRGTTLWDYERLVLEAFPSIFKLKCLPHLDRDNQIAPGNVKLVIVPDFRKRVGGNPLQPKANASLRRSVEDFLKNTHVSPQLEVHVANPAYETLLVDCKVAFSTGFDPGFYSNQLNEDIKRFLSPWAFEDGQDIVFGGKVYQSELLAFVEGRPYVDYVVDFQLYHRFAGDPVGGIGSMVIGVDFSIGISPLVSAGITPTIGATAIGEDFVIGDPVEVAVASSPDSILVSSAEHRIQPLQADAYRCTGVQNVGIGQMVIGIDFIVVS